MARLTDQLSEVDDRHASQSSRGVHDSTLSTAIDTIGVGIKAGKVLADSAAQDKAESIFREQVDARVDGFENPQYAQEISELESQFDEGDDEAVAELEGEIRRKKLAVSQGRMSDAGFRYSLEAKLKELKVKDPARASLYQQAFDKELNAGRYRLALMRGEEQRESAQIEWIDKQLIGAGIVPDTRMSQQDKMAVLAEFNRESVLFEKAKRDYETGKMSAEQVLSSQAAPLMMRATTQVRASLEAIQDRDPASYEQAASIIRREVIANTLGGIRDAKGNPINIAYKDSHIIQGIESEIDKIIDLDKRRRLGTATTEMYEASANQSVARANALVLSNPNMANMKAIKDMYGENFVNLTTQNVSLTNFYDGVRKILEHNVTGVGTNGLSDFNQFLGKSQGVDFDQASANKIRSTVIQLVNRRDDFKDVSDGDYIQHMDGLVAMINTNQDALQKSGVDNAEFSTALQDYSSEIINTIMTDDLEIDDLTIVTTDTSLRAVGDSEAAAKFNRLYAPRLKELTKAIVISGVGGSSQITQGYAEMINLIKRGRQKAKKVNKKFSFLPPPKGKEDEYISLTELTQDALEVPENIMNSIYNLHELTLMLSPAIAIKEEE